MTALRPTPRSAHLAELGQAMGELRGPCIACEGCAGLCAALIDVLLVPDLVLAGKRETP